jgi:hypothetical protein
VIGRADVVWVEVAGRLPNELVDALRLHLSL